MEQIVAAAKRLTAGIFVRHHCHNINGPVLLEYHRRKIAERLTSEKKKEKEEREKVRKLLTSILATTEERGADIAEWTVKQLQDLWKAKKTKEDGKMPTKRTDLLAKCRGIDHRPLPAMPPPEPEGSDDDDIEEGMNLICDGCGICVECENLDKNDGAVVCQLKDDGEDIANTGTDENDCL